MQLLKSPRQNEPNRLRRTVAENTERLIRTILMQSSRAVRAWERQVMEL